MVVCRVHFLALAFTLKAAFVGEGACVRLCVCVGVPVCFLCASVLKAERQSPWLMLHVKLKLAPPEHCNTLHLTTTACPEMTAGRAPIPINPYFPLYSAHLHSFLPAEASSPSHTRAGFILLYKRREQFRREEKRERNSFYMEKGWEAENARERADDISLTWAHWNHWMIDFSLQLSVLFTKNLSTPNRIQQRTDSQT